MAEYIDQYSEESSTGKEKIKEAVKVKTTSSITLSNPVKPLKVEDVTEGNNDIIEWSSEETVVPYYYDIDKKYHRYFVD